MQRISPATCHAFSSEKPLLFSAILCYNVVIHFDFHGGAHMKEEFKLVSLSHDGPGRDLSFLSPKRADEIRAFH